MHQVKNKKDLLAARTARGVSQFKLSSRTSISRFRISMFECGYLELSESELKKITDFLSSIPVRKEGNK